MEISGRSQKKVLMNGPRNMKNVLIISQKFNIAHLSHLYAWEELMNKSDIKSLLYLDKKYKKFISKEKKNVIYDLRNNIEKKDFAIIYNISLSDIRIVKKLKKNNPEIKIFFVYHEPWRGIKEEIIRYHASPKLFIKQVVRRICALKVASNSYAVLLPSKEAVRLYEKKDIVYNRNYCHFPLIFADETNNNIKIEKNYFSFISTASYDKAIDKYIDFVKWASEKDDKILFQISTKTNISEYIDQDISKLINQGRIIVSQGRTLSIDEINKAYNDSCCTWLAYRSSTQSGVLPKTFMWGSPCIAAGVGEFTEIVNGQNGIIVKNINDFDEILNSYYKIQRDFYNFSSEARKTFLNTYCVNQKQEVFWEIVK